VRVVLAERGGSVTGVGRGSIGRCDGNNGRVVGLRFFFTCHCMETEVVLYVGDGDAIIRDMTCLNAPHANVWP
jgi:hypothetical protein